jgi:hypothetical protein
MTDHPEAKSTADLLAEWRAAGRDTVAARAAANVAAAALEAAAAAEEAASQVEAAAKAALESVERARAAAERARLAAAQALETAKGDKVKANHHVVVAEQAESDARDAFHEAEQQAAQRG